MYFYIVGGTMLSLNAWSGAVWHNDKVPDANPGLFLYVAINSFYILDYFVFERVQLYTYDLIHENIGFKLTWGGPFVWGWMFVLPMWGMAPVADPGFSNGWTYFWLIGSAALFVVGWVISRGANLQKYTFKRWPERKFLGIIEPEVIEAGDRKILCSGLWGGRRGTSTTSAKGSTRFPWDLSGDTSPTCGPGPTPYSSCLCSFRARSKTTSAVLRNMAPRSGLSTRPGFLTGSFPGSTSTGLGVHEQQGGLPCLSGLASDTWSS